MPPVSAGGSTGGCCAGACCTGSGVGVGFGFGDGVGAIVGVCGGFAAVVGCVAVVELLLPPLAILIIAMRTTIATMTLQPMARLFMMFQNLSLRKEIRGVVLTPVVIDEREALN